MRYAWVLAALLTVPGVSFGQSPSVLHIRATLLDAGASAVPVPRHALLISDNPATSAPRRVVTRADGTVDVNLRPGSYTVESDRPFRLLGQAYQWTQMVNIVAGRDATLQLTAENVDVVPLTEAPATGGDAPERDPSLLAAAWQESVVAVWSPTSRASGFVVDARGLIATDGNAVGNATTVEVQLSPVLKVPARVLYADAGRGVAVVWVDPAALATRRPIPLPCPPAAVPSLDERQPVTTIATPLRTGTDVVSGAVTALQPRSVETDLRTDFGGSGGPVFNEAGVVVGLTAQRPTDVNTRARGEVAVVRVGLLCEAVTAAQVKTSGGRPPDPDQLPVEPARSYPASALAGSTRGDAGAVVPPVVSSSDFDIAVLTPPMVSRAQQRSDWTGGRTGRSPEAEARIGRLTDFHAWSEYFAQVPPVVIVRVTPKMVEGFWKRLAREAARTQGAELPAFKDFKAGFLKMRVSCGGVDVSPIHPFVLEHHVSEKDVVREGLYVFEPDAIGPQCGTVALTLFSEKTPEKGETISIDPGVVSQIWQDLAPYRASVK